MTLQEMAERVTAFRDERDWAQFHTPKDLALALNVEAGEVAEHFLWKDAVQTAEYVEKNREKIALELGDVLYLLLLLSRTIGVDLEEAHLKQLAKANEKYPVAKAKGDNRKYTEYAS